MVTTLSYSTSWGATLSLIECNRCTWVMCVSVTRIQTRRNQCAKSGRKREAERGRERQREAERGKGVTVIVSREKQIEVGKWRNPRQREAGRWKQSSQRCGATEPLEAALIKGVHIFSSLHNHLESTMTKSVCAQPHRASTLTPATTSLFT